MELTFWEIMSSDDTLVVDVEACCDAMIVDFRGVDEDVVDVDDDDGKGNDDVC